MPRPEEYNGWVPPAYEEGAPETLEDGTTPIPDAGEDLLTVPETEGFEDMAGFVPLTDGLGKKPLPHGRPEIDAELCSPEDGFAEYVALVPAGCSSEEDPVPTGTLCRPDG